MQKNINTSTRFKSDFLVIILIYALVFLFFRWNYIQENLQSKKTIEGLLRNESLVADSYSLSKSISDLESLGLIKCTILTEKHDDPVRYYDSSFNPKCFKNKLLQNITSTHTILRAVNGLKYDLQFQLPIFWQNIFLELATYLLITAASIIYARREKEKKIKEIISSALIQQSTQVSHDIRSPLAALNMIAAQLVSIPESQRLLIRESIGRINDIANQLLEKGKTSLQDSKKERNISPELISPIIDIIVSEKRLQYKDRTDVNIESDIRGGYGLFSKVDSVELKRSISNLIDNSVEAIKHPSAKITVSLHKANETVTISITDNGMGIPHHILQKLGERGVTFGKENTKSGSGLGIYHAKKLTEQFGGSLKIDSTEHLGTCISMNFPEAETPSWFARKLLLEPGVKVISIDDDPSIHNIWHDRFQLNNFKSHDIKHSTFTSGDEFTKWFAKESMNSSSDKKIFLVDYELLNQKQNGMDIIEKFGIGSQSILVTSRYDESLIRDKCKKLNAKLIPKSMAEFIPIEILVHNKEHCLDAILIDDDNIMHRLWNLGAQKAGKQIQCFFTIDEFLQKSKEIALSTPIYIDSNLAGGVKGEVASENLFKLGFENIYLTTGHKPSHFEPMHWIKGIVGKELPWRP